MIEDRESGDDIAELRAELSRRDRAMLGAHRRTQPAVLLTQIARAENTDAQTGRTLVLHAIATARKAAAYSAATVRALDPYDAPTSEMWQTRYEFRPSAAAGLGRRSDLARLWLPLQTRGGAS
jgi:hypothetical protein